MINSAILMPSWVGEFVLALSVVLRKTGESNENLTLIVPRHLIPLCTLLTSLPYFPYRYGNRGELLETLSGIRRQRFNKLYYLSNSFSDVWFSMRTGIPEKRGMGRDRWKKLFVQNQSSAMSHITRDYCEVLSTSFTEPELWQGVSLRKKNDDNGAVVLCPGSGHEVAGGWSGFREIVKMLPDSEIIVLGGKQDVTVAKSIASHLPHRVRNCAGATTIEAAATIIAGASVVIANHSGLMQLAGFLGAPLVGIFGSTSASRFRPLGVSAHSVEAESLCVNCCKRTCQRKDYACFASIPPDRVLSVACSIARRSP